MKEKEKKKKKAILKVLTLSLVLSSYVNIWSAYAISVNRGDQEEAAEESTDLPEEDPLEEDPEEDPSEEDPSEEDPSEEKSPENTSPGESGSKEVYKVTFSFRSNGGKGSMENLVVDSQNESKLTPNAFQKTGCKFTGWNTDPNGAGERYQDKADVSKVASDHNDGKKIILYAQWKLKKPVIKKVKSTSPAEIKVSYKKISGASGYEIQYSVKKTFKNALAKETKSANLLITDAVPGKKYYVRVRGYYKYKGKENYGNWSKVLSVTTKKGSTITNIKSDVAIEADVQLSGSGGGYHAKLVMCTPTSAVSYGIQYDAYAAAPYTGKAMAMIENVSSNNAGGQQYSRPGNQSLKLGKTYRLMMTIDKSGNGNVYLDYEKIGSFYQPNLTGNVALRIEASARRNGDKVNASFSNVKCKWNGKYDPLHKLGWTEFQQNTGLNYTNKNNSFVISGTVNGISGDWDSDYDRVSEILQFN